MNTCRTDILCNFDGSGSTGTGLSYAWTFGEGSPATGALVSHQYPPSYVPVVLTTRKATVTLTVQDSAGRSASASMDIQVYRRY
jgi:PKD repeat protein